MTSWVIVCSQIPASVIVQLQARRSLQLVVAIGSDIIHTMTSRTIPEVLLYIHVNGCLYTPPSHGSSTHLSLIIAHTVTPQALTPGVDPVCSIFRGLLWTDYGGGKMQCEQRNSSCGGWAVTRPMCARPHFKLNVMTCSQVCPDRPSTRLSQSQWL